MDVKTYEKISTTVEVVKYEGGHMEAMAISRWLGAGSAYIPPTATDPREYVQVPTMFGPKDCKPGHYIVKIGPQDFLVYKPEALDAEYREVKTSDHPLVKHAMDELARFPNEDMDFKQSIVNAIVGFTYYKGHSGSSAEIATHMISALLRGENLLPLTDDPEEWELRSGAQYGMPMDLWQNKRNSKAISEDGGKTYYRVDEKPEGEEDSEGRVPVKIYKSEPHDFKPEIDPEDLKSEVVE